MPESCCAKKATELAAGNGRLGEKNKTGVRVLDIVMDGGSSCRLTASMTVYFDLEELFTVVAALGCPTAESSRITALHFLQNFEGDEEDMLSELNIVGMPPTCILSDCNLAFMGKFMP